ncbi:MAG: flagellar motor switch protein FliG [Alphaproteobacteria bacterium]|nr:flagellar motor switch protein FliG [Alphaproteobacteria bacterium]
MAEAKAGRSLTGPQKAAVLMLALKEEHVVKLFSKMDEEEIKEISVAMANLGKMDSDLVEAVFSEFVTRLSSTGSLVGTYEGTERILRQALGEKAGNMMEELRGPAGRTLWDKLGNVNETLLASYLKNEYPQTVAVVLSKIKPDHAARVLAALPEETSIEVINRMLNMEGVRKEVLEAIETTLRNEFMSNLARTTRRDPHESMAEVFNNFDRATETKFMGALEESNRDSAERIKALMLTFEDLAKLDPSSVQTLLRTVEKGKLGLALKGASEGLRDLVFSNMSERAGKIMREDMEQMGPVRLRDVDEAQAEMVRIAKDLAAKGEIIIADSKGEDELIY